MTHHVMKKELLICVGYGIISILQTLNSRFMYKNLQFDYYTFIFSIQKLANIVVLYAIGMRKFDTQHLVHILPFSGFMCVANVVSSYCLTVMPLAAFMAFKKLIILFVLGVSIVFKLPMKLNRLQYICMGAIVVGGIMVGEKDILGGEAFGYVACLVFNLFESFSILYSAFLYREKGFEPQELLMYNSIISLPYYFGVFIYEGDVPEILDYLQNKTTLIFVGSMLVSIFVAATSELTANYIAMKISPFEKTVVSNMKDLILVIISIEWLTDFGVTWISGSGILLCLSGSTIFSIPVLDKVEPDAPLSVKQEQANHLFGEDPEHEGSTSLADDSPKLAEISGEALSSDGQ